MINFFRKTRKNLADKNKPIKYMRYAVGEIVLVVIGILIALQINTWNQKQKQEAKLEKIYTNIQSDLKSDIEEFDQIVKNLTSQFPYYKKIIAKKLTLKDLKTCSECAIFFTGFEDIAIEKGGYNSLQTNSFLFESEKDNSLFTEINKFYSLYDVEISINTKELGKNFWDNRLYLKNNKPWFVEFHQHKLTDEIVDYMLNSWDYRNRVHSTYRTFRGRVNHLKRFKNSALELIEAIDDKVQFGIVKGNHDNGQLKWEGNWKDDKKNGVHKKWYANGQLKIEGLWVNGTQEGAHKKWFKNGQLQIEELWTNGKQHGAQKEWYENGQLRFDELLKNGKSNGIQKAWYENGKIRYKLTSENGSREGQFSIYYDTGQLFLLRNYKDDKQDGVSKSWHEDGKLRLESTMKNGEMISEFIKW